METDVLIIGGGPVGVFLAALLAMSGVRVQIWERRAEDPSGSRAIGIHAPSLDALAVVGASERMLEHGVRVRAGVATSSGRPLGRLQFAEASATHPYVLTLDQWRTESILRRRLDTIAPGALRLGTTFDRFSAAKDEVTASGTDSTGSPVSVQARFLVGADGARSAVRAALGFGWRGRDYPQRYLMADVADPLDSAHGDNRLAAIDIGMQGLVESFPMPDGRRRFVALVTDHDAVPPPTPKQDEGRAGTIVRSRMAASSGQPQVERALAQTLVDIVHRRTGVRADAETCTMTSRFQVRQYAADQIGAGRAVLIGDAAHEISPFGGLGMNLGWLDAAALAPLLTQAIMTSARPGDATEWATFARRRVALARRGALQSRLNMAFGIPTPWPVRSAREALVSAALHLPTAGMLARLYAMGWA